MNRNWHYNVFLTARIKDNYFSVNETYAYEAEIQYECGVARRFEESPGLTEQFQNLTCQWDGSWAPTQDLKPCICECYVNALVNTR